MPAFIVSALVGIVCIVLGISNMKGNIAETPMSDTSGTSGYTSENWLICQF